MTKAFIPIGDVNAFYRQTLMAMIAEKRKNLRKFDLTDEIKKQFEDFKNEILESEVKEIDQNNLAFYNFRQEKNIVYLDFSTEHHDQFQISKEGIFSDKIKGKWIIEPESFTHTVSGDFYQVELTFSSDKKLPLLIYDFDCDVQSYDSIVSYYIHLHSDDDMDFINYLNYKYSLDELGTITGIYNNAFYLYKHNQNDCVYFLCVYSLYTFHEYKGFFPIYTACKYMIDNESYPRTEVDNGFIHNTLLILLESPTIEIYLYYCKFRCKDNYPLKKDPVMVSKALKSIRDQIGENEELKKHYLNDIEKLEEQIKKDLEELEKEAKKNAPNAFLNILGKGVDILGQISGIFGLAYLIYKSTK